MVEVSELRYGSIIRDVHGNRKEVVYIGDDATEREGEELLTTDSAGHPAIRTNNLTGRGMYIIRKDMLYTYDLIKQ